MKSRKKTPPKAAAPATERKPLQKNADGVVLLSGGRPQISKGDGDASVQAYLEAMPGWKRAVGDALDALIVQTVPGVQKAVRWNTSFYGIAGQGWFLAMSCSAKFVQVAFLKGTALKPMPPVESKDPNTRYYKILEGDEIEIAAMTNWLKQASKLPGDLLF